MNGSSKEKKVWKEVWRDAVVCPPEDGRLVIVAAGTSVFKVKYDAQQKKYLRKKADEYFEITNVWGWIPWPSTLPYHGVDLPLEVAYHHLQEEYYALKAQIQDQF